MSTPNLLYVGMDVHKDSVMIAVLPEHAKEPTRVERVGLPAQHVRIDLGA